MQQTVWEQRYVGEPSLAVSCVRAQVHCSCPHQCARGRIARCGGARHLQWPAPACAAGLSNCLSRHRPHLLCGLCPRAGPMIKVHSYILRMCNMPGRTRELLQSPNVDLVSFWVADDWVHAHHGSNLSHELHSELPDAHLKGNAVCLTHANSHHMKQKVCNDSLRIHLVRAQARRAARSGVQVWIAESLTCRAEKSALPTPMATTSRGWSRNVIYSQPQGCQCLKVCQPGPAASQVMPQGLTCAPAGRRSPRCRRLWPPRAPAGPQCHPEQPQG